MTQDLSLMIWLLNNGGYSLYIPVSFECRAVESLKSVIAQWLAHLPLVLEVPGSILARWEENFGVVTRFL